MKIRIHRPDLVASLRTETDIQANEAAIREYLTRHDYKSIGDIQAYSPYSDVDKEVGWPRVYAVYAQVGNDKTMSPVAYCSEPVTA